jgi:hypothetical protein
MPQAHAFAEEEAQGKPQEDQGLNQVNTINNHPG